MGLFVYELSMYYRRNLAVWPEVGSGSLHLASVSGLGPTGVLQRTVLHAQPSSGGNRVGCGGKEGSMRSMRTPWVLTQIDPSFLARPSFTREMAIFEMARNLATWGDERLSFVAV